MFVLKVREETSQHKQNWINMMEDYSVDSRKRTLGEVDGDSETQKKFARGTRKNI